MDGLRLRFIMENPIKIDDLGVPLFLETPVYVQSLRGTNISLLGKRNVMFKSVLVGDMLVPKKVYISSLCQNALGFLGIWFLFALVM